MGIYDHRVEKLENQKRASSGCHLIIVMDGETEEAAKKRLGFDPETPCALIILTSSDAALL